MLPPLWDMSNSLFPGFLIPGPLSEQPFLNLKGIKAEGSFSGTLADNQRWNISAGSHFINGAPGQLEMVGHFSRRQKPSHVVKWLQSHYFFQIPLDIELTKLTKAPFYLFCFPRRQA